MLAAPVFLAACAAGFTLLYGLPLALAPLSWARRLGWTARPDDLTVYLGRCLGCVIIAVSLAAAHAAATPALRPIMLELLVAAFGTMVVVHVVGHVKRTQPPLESAEIPGFVALTLISAFLRFA